MIHRSPPHHLALPESRERGAREAGDKHVDVRVQGAILTVDTAQAMSDGGSGQIPHVMLRLEVLLAKPDSRLLRVATVLQVEVDVERLCKLIRNPSGETIVGQEQEAEENKDIGRG